VARRLVVVGVAALGEGLDRVVRLALVGAAVALEAVVLEVVLAVVALAARAALGAVANAVADLVPRVGAGLDDTADDLVSDDGGEAVVLLPATGDDVNVSLMLAWACGGL
jgi:hypothetical protein